MVPGAVTLVQGVGVRCWSVQTALYTLLPFFCWSLAVAAPVR